MSTKIDYTNIKATGTPSADQILLWDSGQLAWSDLAYTDTGSAIVFNEAGEDVDFRVEGSTQANLFFINAGTNTVNMNTSTAAQILALINANTDGDGISINLGNGSDALTVANDFMIFRDAVGPTVVGTIDSDGAGGTRYNQTSDIRLKSNIVPMENALERLLKLKPVSFDMAGKHKEGLVAQWTLDVYPQAVAEPKARNEYYMIDYSRFVPLLIGAIQELWKEVRKE